MKKIILILLLLTIYVVPAQDKWKLITKDDIPLEFDRAFHPYTLLYFKDTLIIAGDRQMFKKYKDVWLMIEGSDVFYNTFLHMDSMSNFFYYSHNKIHSYTNSWNYVNFHVLIEKILHINRSVLILDKHFRVRRYNVDSLHNSIKRGDELFLTFPEIFFDFTNHRNHLNPFTTTIDEKTYFVHGTSDSTFISIFYDQEIETVYIDSNKLGNRIGLTYPYLNFNRRKEVHIMRNSIIEGTKNRGIDFIKFNENDNSFDYSFFAFDSTKSDRFVGFTFDTNNTAWFWNDWPMLSERPLLGLLSFDGENWVVYDSTNTGLPTHRIFSIAVDSENNKWLATDKGLIEFNEKGLSSVEQTLPEETINLFPNPTKDLINLTVNGDYHFSTYSISDINGRSIAKNITLNSNQINIQNLSKGVYFIEFTTIDGRKTSKKFVKE